jgi:hypothetical protein
VLPWEGVLNAIAGGGRVRLDAVFLENFGGHDVGFVLQSFGIVSMILCQAFLSLDGMEVKHNRSFINDIQKQKRQRRDIERKYISKTRALLA